MPPLNLGLGLGLCSYPFYAVGPSGPSFTLDFTTLTGGAVSLAPYALSFSRASGSATVQTSTATLASGIAVDTPRAGRLLTSDAIGLLVEASRTNSILQSRNMTTANWANDGSGATRAFSSSYQGPDGSASTNLIACPSGSYGARQNYNTTSAGVFTWSGWIGSPTGLAVPYAGNVYWNGPRTQLFGTTSTWKHLSITGPSLGSGVLMIAFALDGRDYSGSGGVAAQALSNLVDLQQSELGMYPTSAIVTTTGAVTRQGEHPFDTNRTRWISNGRIGFETTLRPLGAATEYLNNMRLWTIDAGNYAEISQSTQKVTVVVNDASYTTARAAAWARNDRVQFWTEVGNGVDNTIVKYAINGAAAVTLGTSGAAQGSIGSSGALDLFCNGTANQLGAFVENVSAWPSGVRPVWAA